MDAWDRHLRSAAIGCAPSSFSFTMSLRLLAAPPTMSAEIAPVAEVWPPRDLPRAFRSPGR
eukprot:1621242-Pyramimonas_sp.AAC.1